MNICHMKNADNANGQSVNGYYSAFLNGETRKNVHLEITSILSLQFSKLFFNAPNF